jgi:hypothetical protein
MSDNNTQKVTKLFFGSLPTKPDIDKIINAFPPETLTIGKFIQYDTISSLIGSKYGTSRWRTVTFTWRERMRREFNIIFLAGEKKFTVTDSKTRLDLCSRKVATGKRCIMKASEIASSTNKKFLSEDEKKLCDHIATLPGKLRLAELTAPKEIDE